MRCGHPIDPSTGLALDTQTAAEHIVAGTVAYCPCELTAEDRFCPLCGGRNSIEGNDPQEHRVKESASRSYPSFLEDGWFSYEGRARRREYWRDILCGSFVLICVVALTLLIMACDELPKGHLSPKTWGVLIIYGIIFNVLFLPVTIRRCHDSGVSGWIYLCLRLLYLIPLIGFLSVFLDFWLLGIRDGTPGMNRYGADPKGRERGTNC